MDINNIKNLIKDVTPGVWKIGVTYKKPLKILKGKGKGPSPAELAGITEGDLTKEVFRWCSARVNPANTKSAEAARQAKAEKIANGETVIDRPSGFHATGNADDENLIQNSDKTGEPCLILKKGPHADKVKYFLKGQEIPFEEVERLVSEKIVSSTELHELPTNATFNLYPEKVMSIKMGGMLYEGMRRLKEATFNGKSFPDEDGMYGVEEELYEDADYSLDMYYTDEDKAKAKVLGKNTRKGFDSKTKKITESLNNEARKYGYRNYKEYKFSNK